MTRLQGCHVWSAWDSNRGPSGLSGGMDLPEGWSRNNHMQEKPGG